MLKEVADLALAQTAAAAPRILEVGCGSGQATTPFACLGHPLVASDPSDGQRAFLERTAVRADTLDALSHQVIHGDYTEANRSFAKGAVCTIID